MVLDADDCKADPIDANAPLLDGVAQHAPGRGERPDLGIPFGPYLQHAPDAVHVPLHQMPAEPLPERQRALKVHNAAYFKLSQRGAPQRLLHRVENHDAPHGGLHGQTHPVDSDALPEANLLRKPRSLDLQPRHAARLDRQHLSGVLYQARKHYPSPPPAG